MGRLSTVDDAKVFGTVGAQMARCGSITLQDIVSQSGVSVGSLYHRFGSREELLARTWLDAVSVFHKRFLEALESGLPDAGESAAMTTPRFCRNEVDRALVLICCRREELLSSKISKELAQKIESVNVRAVKAISQFARSHGYSVEACNLGLIAYPLGAVRLYLPNKKVPKSIDGYVAKAFRSAVSN